MNAAEHIIESYYRYVKGYYTRCNIKGKGQTELDIIAVDPTGIKPIFYHIESTVSISSNFSKITADDYSPEDEKIRSKKAKQRRTVDFFVSKKFYSDNIEKTYKELKIDKKNVNRILISWDFEKIAIEKLKKHDIKCLTMKEILQELADKLVGETKDIDDDILRAIHLFVRSKPNMPKIYSMHTTRKKQKAK